MVCIVRARRGFGPSMEARLFWTSLQTDHSRAAFIGTAPWQDALARAKAFQRQPSNLPALICAAPLTVVFAKRAPSLAKNH